MKSKCAALIFLILFHFSCTQQPIKKENTTNTSQVFAGVMDNDSIKPPKTVIAGVPKAIMVPLNNKLSKPKPTVLPKAHFINFNTEQGLALAGVLCGFYDKAGNLWFGTWGGGVSKYNGKSFTNFTTAQGLTNNVVRSIAEDNSGNLWFGTSGGGVSKYDGKSFTNYSTKQGLAHNNVISIAVDKSGNIWFGTSGGGASKYDGKSFTNFTTDQGLASNAVFSINPDENGNIWFGTDGGGVSKYNGKSFTNYTTVQGLANNVVKCITKDKAGNLWFGTIGGGVSKYDGKSFTNFTTTEGLVNNSVRFITEDKTGNLWFGTDGGVSKYDGQSFTNFTVEHGLANNFVSCINEDKTGNLWFSTTGGGVSRYDGSSFTNYTVAHGLPDNVVMSLTEDKDGNLWTGNYGGGVCKYDGKSFTNYTTADGLTNNTIWSITEDVAGNLWFGTEGGGVSKFDGKSFTNYTTAHGLAGNIVLSIIEDNKGNLWFGTDGNGVSKFDGKSFTNYTTAQGLANNIVRSMTEDKAGNIWFGTNGGGVSKFDGKYFTNYTMAQGLANNVIISIAEDKSGNLWFGTANGLSYFAVGEQEQITENDQKNNTKGKDKNSVIKIKNYTIANGLPDNYATQVVQLLNGKIAVGTNVGITIFNSSQPLDGNGKLVGLETFNVNTGYPIKDVNGGHNSMYQDSKGIIWAGTGDENISLVRFDYNAIKRNLTPPTVVIQNIKLNEQNICYYTIDSKLDTAAIDQQEIITYSRILTQQERDSIKQQFKGIKFDGITGFYAVPQKLVLPYEHNNLTIEFNCVNVSNHHMVNYQYMLEGYDNDWSPVLKKQEANYGNINEGTYTFKIKAQSPDGVWCEPTIYTFTVLPPWYRTWWMYTCYGILIITLIVLIVWWNGRKLKARAKALTEEVHKATVTISKQKEIVEEQKKVVEEKHKEITDSINYAERIQRALLASKNMLDENLISADSNRDYFILFKPKDVVSGDFYWADKLINNQFVLVCADSTGHGVPGAIMSIVNIACLKEASLQGITSPDLFLNETRRLVIENLRNDGSAEGGKDGMDGSLLSFDFKNNILQCASANNPVWAIRGKELIEIKGDRMPIGRHDKDKTPFTIHTLNLQKGDVVYTLTDGFPDQFGGPDGKKFKYKKLQELLLSISTESMSTQKQKLNDAFDEWKGNLEQVDDVCLIGIRV